MLIESYFEVLRSKLTTIKQYYAAWIYIPDMLELETVFTAICRKTLVAHLL